MKLFQDADGNTSSKRIIGFIFAAAALTGGFSAIFIKSDTAVAVDIVRMFLYASVSMLVGGTVAEKISAIGNK